MIKAIMRFIQKEQFHPGGMGIFVNPYYFARKGLYENIRAFSGYIKGTVLDVGCGCKPYKNFFKAENYIGLEIYKSREYRYADVLYCGYKLPFKDDSFESVVSFEVLEHIFNPEAFLKEIFRVLKTNGTLLITAPFIWDEHEQPSDYARYSSFGLKYIIQRCGFDIVEHKKTLPDVRAVFQLISAYIYKIAVSENTYIDFFVTLLVIAPFNILGEILSKILPANADFYLDNIVLAQKNNKNKYV